MSSATYSVLAVLGGALIGYLLGRLIIYIDRRRHPRKRTEKQCQTALNEIRSKQLDNARLAQRRCVDVSIDERRQRARSLLQDVDADRDPPDTDDAA